MSLDQIANVTIPPEGTHKFIIVELSDGTKNKNVLVSYPRRELHKDICLDYIRRIPQGITFVNVNGGGRLEIKENRIYAYGKSHGYGTAQPDTVKTLLKEYINQQDHEIALEIRMGYGY